MNKNPTVENAAERDVARLEQLDEHIHLLDIVRALWASRLIVMLFVIASSVASVVYALSMPNIYRASALLAPAEQNGGGFGGLLQQQYGGLASLAGLSIPNGALSKSQLAVAMMESRLFTSKFVEDHKLLPELLAVDYWDSKTRELVYNGALINLKSGVWIGDDKPIEQDVYEALQSAITVNQDKTTNLYTVSVVHESPDVAQMLVQRLVRDINETIREKEIKEAKHSIEYLKAQVANTSLADLEQVLYELMQSQMQTMTLANVRPEYVFVTLDPAVVPDERESPNRMLICFVGAFLGGLLGLFIALIRHFVRQS